MKRMSRGIGVSLALTAIVLLPACSGKDMQITELQTQVDELRAANQDLESRLARALSAGDQARQMALSLQQQLDEARSQLASGQARAADLPPGWHEGAEGLAWVDIAGDILFDSGKAKLKQGGADTVAAIAQDIKQNFANRQIIVLGHTDSDPIKVTKNLYEDNLDLSLTRAATVTRELLKLGVDAKQLIAGGQGEHNPRAPNDAASKAQNRRVEIIALQR